MERLPEDIQAAAAPSQPACRGEELHWALRFLDCLINPDLPKVAADWGPLNRLSGLLICLHRRRWGPRDQAMLNYSAGGGGGRKQAGRCSSFCLFMHEEPCIAHSATAKQANIGLALGARGGGGLPACLPAAKRRGQMGV